MFPIIKTLHLLCGVSILGIIIAAFFYIARSIKKGDRALIDYSLRASYFGDAAILLCIIIQGITAYQLVRERHFNLGIPWIFIAWLAFGLLILLWLLTLVNKIGYLSKTEIAPAAVKLFYVLNFAIILVFMLIIHDAVTHTTGLEFLFRGS